MSLVDEPGDRRGLLPRYTLKDANTFLLADALGDIQGSDDGLFTNDTRVLSRLEVAIAGRRPSLLGAAINQDNTVFTAHLTNRPLAALGALALPQGVIHIERSRFLSGSRLYERLIAHELQRARRGSPAETGVCRRFRRHIRSAGARAQGARRSSARARHRASRAVVVPWT